MLLCDDKTGTRTCANVVVVVQTIYIGNCVHWFDDIFRANSNTRSFRNPSRLIPCTFHPHNATTARNAYIYVRTFICGTFAFLFRIYIREFCGDVGGVGGHHPDAACLRHAVSMLFMLHTCFAFPDHFVCARACVLSNFKRFQAETATPGHTPIYSHARWHVFGWQHGASCLCLCVVCMFHSNWWRALRRRGLPFGRRIEGMH